MASRPRSAVKNRRQRGARGGASGRATIAIGFLLVFSVAGIFALITPFVAAFSAYAYAANALSQLNFTSHEATFQTSTITDRNGKKLYQFVDPLAGRRTQIPLAQIPETLRDATIAIEDKNFYTNPGFDVTGMARAFYDDLTHRSILEGASTITQQLVKRVYLSDEQSFQRKFKEIAMAYTLSKEKSKDDILEMYLNQIYYGNQAYGIEAASETYFGKTAIKLDLAEAALLAGLPQSPSEYDPITNLKGAKGRQLEVLNAMVNQGYLSQQQAVGAYDEVLHFATQRTDIQAPWFVFYVRDALEKKYGPQFLYSGLTIKTTLDLNMENQAEKIIQDQLAKVPKAKNVNNAALVALDPHTGQILAMVGSRDYSQNFPNGTMDGKFNAATGMLQPGSSWKVFEYAADFLKGKTPASIVDDTRVTNEFPNFDGTFYRPENYDKKFHGRVTYRIALDNSLNVPAVKVLKDAGIHETLQLAHSMGITSITDESQVGLSLALGTGEVTPLDITSAYGVLANGGQRMPPTPILSITDSTGKVIEQFQQPAPAQVLKPEDAYLITSILSDDKSRCTPQVCEFGRHSVLELPDRPAAAKTGTSEEFRANWTLGYTPDLVVGVWAGNSNHQPMRNVIGIDGAGPIWHDFMEYAEKGKPAASFTKPPNIVTMRVSSITGLIPNPGEPSYSEVFVKGTEPKQRSTYMSLTHDQAAATATAVAAYATAFAEGTPLPAGVSLTPPAIPTADAAATATAAANATPVPSGTPTAGGTPAASGTPAVKGTPSASGSPQPAGTPTPTPHAGVVKVSVPNVVGLPQSQAEITIRASGLTVGSVTYSNPGGSSQTGSVIGQNPAPGQRVDVSSNVTMVVRR
ncbi:MAG TPA: PBP1A family penicillin-binding protein [Chloroflexota bacterium]|nr:PBP1A family penicillin-binding protein [Chloroflexota bacterium]